MKLNNLGTSQLEFSTLGLGTWAMGGQGWEFSWGSQNDADSVKTIHKALDLGINWIDTAAVYGLGHSEIVVGKAIKGMPERPLIATKCSRVWDTKGNISINLKKQNILHEAEDSLKRLQIDTIDLYQMHRPAPEEDIEEGWGAMAELVIQGKVRYIGLSNVNIYQIALLDKIHPITSIQPPYSMLARDVEEELLPYCSGHNIGVISYSPMYKGFLTGKVTTAWVDQLPPDDHRRKDMRFQSPELEINMEFVKKLVPIAERKGVTLAQLAIAWVLRRDEVTSAIVGGRKPEQIESVVRASDIMLDHNDISLIQGLLKGRDEKIKELAD